MSSTSIARAWAISRADGLTLGFTDHDSGLEFDGIRFRPDTGLSAKALVQSVGLSVDNTEAEGALSDDAITEVDILAGRWDGASLRMWEVDWADVTARRLLFRGSLGEVSRSAGAFRAELRGLSEPLNSPNGRVYHPRCAARLGDAACGVDLSDPRFAAGGDIRDLDSTGVVTVGVSGSYTAGWFEGGRLVAKSGAAQGLSARVKTDRDLGDGRRRIELWEPLGLAPAPGDQVTLLAGCDKRAATCRAKFGNFLNFRGFPHLPSEDWLIAPQAGGPHV